MDSNELLRTASKVTADSSWFNGSSDSIFNRLDRIQDLLDGLRMAASSDSVDQITLERYASFITELDEEKDQLQKVASEYVDFDTEEYLQNLPGGTVASNYHIALAGTVDLGEDDGSLLYRTAASVESEYREADWINFVTAGAEVWVEDQNYSLLNDQLSTREAAVFYVEKKTLPILDVTKRAAIIDNFVENVEICRRAKKQNIDARTSVTAKKMRLASTFTANAIDESLGDQYNWF